MRYIKRHQILGKNGVYEILRTLYPHPASEKELIKSLADTLSNSEIKTLLQELREIWFIEQPPKSESLRITEDGMEAYLLARVINGDTLDSVINRLSRLRYPRFSLITEDITGCFIDVLKSLPDLKGIYICSPWVRLYDIHLSYLESVLGRGKIVIRVITRVPIDSEPMWRDQILQTLNWLKKHGAEIVGHPKLHTKLYIAHCRDTQVAIFGSENLTGAKNIELGIKISDEAIVGKLLSYWLGIYNQCTVL